MGEKKEGREGGWVMGGREGDREGGWIRGWGRDRRTVKMRSTETVACHGR